MPESIDFKWIKEHYFSDKSKVLELKKGDVLLNSDQKNQRLYLVLEGKFLGFLKDAELEGYPIFEATKNKFIGVYSYFSSENLSYSKVVATQDSRVAYYDKSLLSHHADELEKLMPFLMSVVVNELYSRQHFAKSMAKEKHENLQRLLKAEKMATLGQLAAGLAHELNNSIAVLGSSLESVESFIAQCIHDTSGTLLTDFFQKGLKEGQFLSSEVARNQRTLLENELPNLSKKEIKNLSKTGIEIGLIKSYVAKNPEHVSLAHHYWEIGSVLQKMKIAAQHSSHVVKSVRQLGVAEHQWTRNVEVNESIREALVMVQSLTRRVKTDIALNELPLIEASHGELVQVWINLIKNALESMIQGGTPSPELHVKSELLGDQIVISVEDNGPGIPKKILTQIFEPSFTTKVGGLSFGLGLGLSIVLRIITEHRGTIEVTSKEGKTTFTVKIPLN